MDCGPSRPPVAILGAVSPEVARYSGRPELWDGVGGLSDDVWPEYNHDGATLTSASTTSPSAAPPAMSSGRWAPT